MERELHKLKFIKVIQFFYYEKLTGIYLVNINKFLIFLIFLKFVLRLYDNAYLNCNKLLMQVIVNVIFS